MTLRPVALALLALGVAARVAPQPAPEDVFAGAGSARGDLALATAVAADEGVETEVPAPGWSEYAFVLAEALQGWFSRRSRWLRELLGVGSASFAVAVKVLLLALLVVLVSVLVHVVLRLRARPAPALDLRVRHRARPAAPGCDAWRAELDARLAAGDVAGALRALWWWLARSLGGDRVDAAWTSSELIRALGRRDLAPLTGGLDRMLYGAAAPGIFEVRELRSRLERALA